MAEFRITITQAEERELKRLDDEWDKRVTCIADAVTEYFALLGPERAQVLVDAICAGRKTHITVVGEN